MSELDKFKRRVIRSVARLLLKEKKSPEELWKEMKKETVSDCRTLWERMRALCVKKLNHMIAVDDRSANLPSIARLSLTDWLLVDLVLVHEEIDVIAMDKPDNKEYPALIELFSLVQRFDIEGRSGEPLAEAWAAATVYYNRQGRQCSPMLLQRRWYQLKKLARCRFYKFWFSYKGNTRLLEDARKSMPSRLQMAIAKRYPEVITKEYPDWDELIEKRFVIMPEEFEAKMRMPNLPKPCNSNAPDLVVVEPVIETIDLRVESDPEDQNDDEMEDTSDPERSNDATDITHPATEEESPVAEEENPVTEEEIPVPEEEIPINDEASGIQVKTEPMEEDGLSNVQLISATHVPEVEIPDDSPYETPEVVSTNLDNIVVKSEVSQMETSPDDDEDDVIEIPSVTPVVDVSAEKIVQIETAEIPSNNVPCDVDIIKDSDDAVDDIIKVKADEYCRKKDEVPVEKNNAIDDLIKDKVESYLKTTKEAISLSEKKPDGDSIDMKNKANVAAIDLMADLNFVDDGIEFVDDGVEFVEEDHAQTIESTTNIPSSKPIEDNLTSVEKTEKEDDESNKFDLKLLMYPVVYTTKLDQMKTFKNKEIDSVKGIEDIEMAAIESKPVSNQSLDIKIKEETVISTAEDTADSDDLFINREVTDDEDSEEDIIVPQNSYMLKKPRTRTYDPIKLCKNPDFNTKLKRLTIGFLSSTRNRQLLNACIPMTIDLSKAFESKLVNGTLYLKSSGTAPIVEKQEVIEKQASSIVPTAMPVQSLIDNSKVDIQNLIPHESPIVSERTKVINLPDIDKVRRINQQLLTAQVPPLRVFADNCRAINPQEVNPTVSTVPSIEPVQPGSDSTPIQNTLPKIKIEGEKSEIDSVSTETLPPAKEKLLKMINQAKILTKEALDKIDDVTKPKDFPMPIVVQEVKNNIPQEVPTRKYQPRVPLPWAPKHAVLTKNNIDDFGLLTSDTLNKMLHLLTSGKEGDGCKCCNVPKKKKKKGKCKKSQDQQKDSDNSDTVQEVDKEDESKKSEVAVAKQAPKQTNKVVPVSKVVKTKFCCWANQKLNNRRRNSRHLCPPNPCQCCCADKLVKKIQTDEEARRLKMMAKTVVELSDDEEDSLRKACESIETVVQQSALLTDQVKDRTSTVPAVSVVDRIPVPIVNMVQKSLNVSNVTVVENTPRVPIVTKVDNAPDVPDVTVVSPAKPSTPSINVEVVAPSISKVTIDLGANANEIKETPTTPTKPYMKIRAAPIASLMPANRPAVRPIINRPTIPQINPVTVNRVTLPRVQIHSQRKPSQWASCSCQRPALSQDSRRNIVIDASEHCAIHPTPIAPKQNVSPQKTDTIPETPKEKILYLHSKSLAKSPSESPIFLGKNKILLTTVKFPRKNDEVAPPTEVFQAPKVIPTLPLPAGVQLVLMPSGNVTYTVDPGVELDEAQLAALPTILAAVQEQLNASGVTSSPAISEPQASAPGEVEPVTAMQPEITGSENTNLPQSDETAETPQAESNNNELTDSPVILETNEVFQDTELPPKSTNDVDMEVDTQTTKADAPTEQNTSTTSTSDLEKESAPMTNDTVNEATVDSEAPKDITEVVQAQTVPVIEESQSEKQTLETQSVAEDKEAPEVTHEIQSGTEEKENGISNRKSLLSDLMEMSGISAEDTTVPDPPAPEPSVIDRVQHAAIENDESRNLPELSPVTSFAELKYACEQNGKFFKLDFDTGVIVPINVCIKKNPKTKTTPTKTKEFIDLTDDVETVESTDVENSELGDTLNKSTDYRPAGSSLLKEPVEYLYNGKTVNVSSSIVKPVKLFKAFHPTPKVPRVLKASPRIVPSYNSPSLNRLRFNKRTHVEKRKQKFTIVRAKVEAKIDLVDSDEPMEEEYLLDSSDDDKSDNDTEPMLVEALNTSLLDDSSDDEPLAKKSKRLKEADEKEVRKTNIFDEIPDAASPDELSKDMNDLVEDIETAAVTGGTDQVQQISVEKDLVPTSSQKDTSYSKRDKPQAKVRKILESNVIVRSEGPIIELNVHNPVDNQSDDEELDKAPPELRFLSDHSEDGDGDEDCILGF